MTLNFPGPEQLRIFYTVDAGGLGALQHVMQLNFSATETPAPGTPFSDIDVEKRAAAASALDGLVASFRDLLVPLLDADDATIDYAECWHFEPGTFDASYVSSLTLGVAGSGVGAPVVASQDIYSFRSAEGGAMRVVLMEGNTASGASLGYADMSAANQAFVDFFIHVSNSIFIARDTSWPIAFTKMHPGQNEALFKRRYRQ